MADIDRLIRQTLQDRSESAPDGHRLLAGVRARSRSLRRRRRATLVGGFAASLAIAIPFAIAGVHLTSPPPQPGPQPSTATVDSPRTLVSPQPSASSGVSSPGVADGSAAAGPSAPPASARGYDHSGFPLRLGPADASGYEPAVVTQRHGLLSSYNEAKDPVGGADITLVVTENRPEFDQAAGAVNEVTRRVRGRQGTLRTVAVSPAAELTVYWQESANQWVQLRTDDTFTPDEVVGFANRLVVAG